MREPAWSVDRLLEEIAILGSRGLSRQQYFAELGPRLRRVVGNDASCWHTLDPQTRLLTSDEPTDLIENGIYTAETAAAAGELLVRSEYLIEDRNTFAELASRRVPVGILSKVTRGDPSRSARYRDLLEPSGIPHEMRAVFSIRGRVWGAVHIARREGSGDFSQADAEALARVAGPIALGIRGALRFDAARREGIDAPGLVLLGADDEVEMITPRARELLDSAASEAISYGELRIPAAVLAIAHFVRGDPASSNAGGNAVSIPGRDGWINLQASTPDRAGGRVAIVVEPATARSSATLRLETHGVTGREREVATLIARGLSNAEIAAALVLSSHTVEDHTKALFEKVGVRSRRELVAHVFLDEYLPEVVQRTDLTSRGRFERE